MVYLRRLDSIAILTILSLPIQEQGIAFHLFKSSLIFLLMFHSSQCLNLSPPWSGLFLNLGFFFGVILNETVF